LSKELDWWLARQLPIAIQESELTKVFSKRVNVVVHLELHDIVGVVPAVQAKNTKLARFLSGLWLLTLH